MMMRCEAPLLCDSLASCRGWRSTGMEESVVGCECADSETLKLD